MPKDLNIENPLDSHLKPVKDSDGTDSALEVSTDTVRVNNLVVSGTTTGVSASDDTKHPLTTVGIADDNLVEIDDADAADNDYAKFTANGLEGRSYTEVKTDLSLNNVSNDAQLPLAGGTMTGDLNIAATDKITFDGGGDTYITESSADVLQVYAGGDKIAEITEATTGNKVDFGTTGVGFTQFEPTYNASDTNVTFNDNGNKAFVTFGAGNITDMNLYFPDISCNCVLLLKQDGTGSRTVTNWKTFDQADGNESTVLWAGGSAPTLTTTANKIDIISLYWDNDNHKAYGVASLNF